MKIDILITYTYRQNKNSISESTIHLYHFFQSLQYYLLIKEKCNYVDYYIATT